jgi:hypothetical protein
MEHQSRGVHPLLVLPSSLLERELKQASEAVQNQMRMARQRRQRRRRHPVGTAGSCIPEEDGYEDDGRDHDAEDRDPSGGDDDGSAEHSDEDADDELPQKELEEELLSSEELLRRARARLLEDLMMEGKLGDSAEAGSGGSASSEKGTGVALPHSFEKYREVRIARDSAPLQRWFVIAVVFFRVVVVFPPALSGSAIVVSI